MLIQQNTDTAVYPPPGPALKPPLCMLMAEMLYNCQNDREKICEDRVTVATDMTVHLSVCVRAQFGRM